MQRGILTMAILAGGLVGALVAAGTVPDPSCVEGDSMCLLQRLYLAQGIKVVGGMCLGYGLAALVVVRAPAAVRERQASRRRARHTATTRAAQADKVTIDARAARAAFDQAQRPVGLPAAAMSVIAQQRPAREATRPVGARPAAGHLAGLEATLLGPGAIRREVRPGATAGGAVRRPIAPAAAHLDLGPPVGLPPQALSPTARSARAAAVSGRRPDPATSPRRAGLPAPAALGPGGVGPHTPAGLPAAALRANAAARVGGLRARPQAPPASTTPRGLRARPTPPGQG